MPPQKRTPAKAKDQVKVEPASAAQPRPGPTTPSKKEVAAALEQSAEFIEQQNSPPMDVHPNPTTPSKAEVEAAVEQSIENLETQGVAVGDISIPSATAAAPVTVGRDATRDATPVSAGGTNPSLAATPVPSGRDKLKDAKPTFVAPPPTEPRN